jgi:hypothetical protein
MIYVVELSVVMLGVIMLGGGMLNIVVLSVFMLNVVLVIAFTPSVVAPCPNFETHSKKIFHFLNCPSKTFLSTFLPICRKISAQFALCHKR